MTCCIDNETDLRAALADGGEVRVDGSVTISLASPLVIDRPATLTGGVFTVDTSSAIEIASSDVTVQGVRITGPGLGATYDGGQKLIHAQGCDTSPLERVAVRDCRLTGSRGNNVWLDWCRDTLVDGCHITEYRYSGVMVISGERVTARGCHIADAPLIDPVVNTYGVAVTDIDNTEAARSVNCTVSGNTVDRIDWEGIDTHGGDGLVVSGNTVTACPRGVALVVGNSTRETAPRNCVVTGNRIDGAGSREPVREGIHLAGIPYTPASGTVTGNHITGHAPPFHFGYIDRGATYVGGNNLPMLDWTPITLDEFVANDSYPPQLRVDGNTVTVRGGVIPSTGRDIIGHVPLDFARPDALTFLGYTKGSNGGAGNGMVGIWPDGKIQLFYHSGSDSYTYFLSGSYQAA